ncbi:hypothetical protein ACWGOQ_0003045 [Aquimarina sp. M1]
MSKRTIPYILLMILLFSCAQKTESNDKKKPASRSSLKAHDPLNREDSVKNTKLESVTDSSKKMNDIYHTDHTDSIIKLDTIHAFLKEVTLHVNVFFSHKEGEKYSKIPFLLKNDKLSFRADQYPDQLVFREIPNTIDTLQVITGAPNCPNDCLEVIKIQTKNGIEIFHELNYLDEKVVQQGVIDTILEKRGMKINDIYRDEYIISKLDNWKSETELSKNINQNYVLTTNLKWLKIPEISSIKREVDMELKNFVPLDSLQKIYQHKMMPQKNVTFDNLLSEEEAGYAHSGGFLSKLDSNIILRIDSIDIIYISAKNELYPVSWIRDYTQVIDENEYPFDDNYVAFENEQYKINKWDDNTKINLFHNNMPTGKYIVLYEVKLKNPAVYIQSPLETINYKFF